MLGSVFSFFQSAVFAELMINCCPIGGRITQHLLISSAKTADWGKLKTDPSMSGGGIEMTPDKINHFGDREIGVLAGGQLPHFRGAEVMRSQTRSTYDENQLWKV